MELRPLEFRQAAERFRICGRLLIKLD
jgi:hypothetical protein